jgi:hypothetical protein
VGDQRKALMGKKKRARWEKDETVERESAVVNNGAPER